MSDSALAERTGRTTVAETRVLEESLASHIDLSSWVRSVGGHILMHSGIVVAGPQGEEVPLSEGDAVSWDGERFSPGKVHDGKQLEEQG